ncbi:MAG: hypothetical protein PUP93_23830 [Rhizonema sp. NSF051]|nr:hypothetical protein [Rhizonema sp. NSF051]
MTTRRPRIAFICDDEVKEILEEWATDENRTVSNLVESIVLDAIKFTGRNRKTKSPSSKNKEDK